MMNKNKYRYVKSVLRKTHVGKGRTLPKGRFTVRRVKFKQERSYETNQGKAHNMKALPQTHHVNT